MTPMLLSLLLLLFIAISLRLMQVTRPFTRE